MKNQELLSKEWCDLIFEGRNRDYGAYELRRTVGHRYAVALRLFFGTILVFVLIAAAIGLYVFKQVHSAIEELEQITQMEELTIKDNHVHEVAQGRRVKPHMSPGASMSKPEIIEGISFTLPLGNDGPEAVKNIEDDLLFLNQDSIDKLLAEDLPEDGIRLTPAEDLEEMPQFPGGIGSLMKWLDEHIIYTPASIREKVQGDMEITFIIDKNGMVKETKVTKSLNASLDRIAMAAIKQMPKWRPGRSGGKAIIAQITLPIHFQLK